MRILRCHEMHSMCWSSSIVQAVNTLPFGDTRELHKLSSFVDNCCNLAVCTYQKKTSLIVWWILQHSRQQRTDPFVSPSAVSEVLTEFAV